TEMANLESKSTSTSVRTDPGSSGTTTLTPSGAADGAAPSHRVGGGLLDPHMLWKSLPDAVRKLDPRVQLRNPVMFVVEVGSILTTYSAIIHSSAFSWL